MGDYTKEPEIDDDTIAIKEQHEDFVDFEKSIVRIDTPNKIVGKNQPKVIVIHWVDGSYKSATSWFASKESNVAAHFVVNSYGDTIAQMANLDDICYHAGTSYHPLTGKSLNKCSIGIELSGPPSAIKRTSWNEEQIVTVAKLCRYIKSKVSTIIGVTDHSTISPGRKQDVIAGTGKDVDIFPWQHFIDLTGMENLSTEEIRKQIVEWYNTNK